MAKGASKGKGKQPPKQTLGDFRITQIVITCIIMLVFWNLLDFILDEYVTHEGYVFDVYYDVALPIIVALAVEFFPKRKK
ncbi:MAG: hypothetical protein Q3963_08280 [Coriobacteriaceae bacterium]|nr:hypothetical protein [Coriobacteriaceae bacterium]